MPCRDHANEAGVCQLFSFGGLQGIFLNPLGPPVRGRTCPAARGAPGRDYTLPPPSSLEMGQVPKKCRDRPRKS